MIKKWFALMRCTFASSSSCCLLFVSESFFFTFFYWFQELRVFLSPSEFRCAKWKVHFHEKFISSFTPRQASTIRISLVVVVCCFFCVLHNKTCRQKVICEISSLLGNCTRCRVMENRNFISHILRHTTHIAIAFNAVWLWKMHAIIIAWNIED